MTTAATHAASQSPPEAGQYRSARQGCQARAMLSALRTVLRAPVRRRETEHKAAPPAALPIPGRSQPTEKDRVADPEDGTEHDRISGLDCKIHDDAAAASECPAGIRAEQKVDKGRNLRREPHQENPCEEDIAEIGSHEVSGTVE